MFTTSTPSLRRLSGYVLPLLLSSACVCADVAAQSPLAVSGNATAVPHNESYGAPWQSAVTNRGDFVLFDFKTTGMYEYPANKGAEITLAAPGAIAGGFTDSGIAIDPRNNNIYLNNNYNGGLLEYPFDAATGTWDLPSVVVANGLSGNLGGACGNYFQAAGMSMNHNGILAVATENGCGVEIFTVPVDASGNFGAATAIVSNMKQRAKTVAIDDAGNISYNADSGGFVGAAFIPAGTTGLADESTVARIDPNLGSVQGVTIDSAGDVFVVDGSAGAYLIPLVSGVPNTAGAILISSVPANGGPSFDETRGILFYPTSGSGSIKDLADIYINRAELGAVVAPASAATSGTVTYTFTASATPASFVLDQAGSTFALGALTGCGITPATASAPQTTTTYAANTSCTLPVSFTPTLAGDASATLVMLDASGNVLNTTVLHGVGQASAAVVSPGLESAIGAGLQTPVQVAADALGNVYVADSGQGKVLLYPAGSTAATAPTSIGTGLSAPTGVAVDGAGDLFIADGGNVIEVPSGTSGLNAAGQTTLKSGLGTNVRLAADAVGDVFAADPDNQRVVRLRNSISGIDETDVTGLTQLLAIASDGAGNLYVANGTNLIEVSAFYQQTLLTSLSGVSGLAVDASGALYVTQTAGTVRIPNEAGTLTTADEVTIAPAATSPTSVAVDPAGNAYVTDAGAKDIDKVSAVASLNFGTLATTASTQTATATIVDSGNAPLNITGFTSTLDYSETATTCVGSALAVGASCSATITFNPGPGDQGTLTGVLTVQSDAANAPVSIDLTGVGASLAASTTALTVTNPTVTSAPVSVTVASKSGTGPTPTGNVTLVLTASGSKPITFTSPLVNGAVSFNATDIQAGTYTFTVNYIGDRVYGTSSASQSVTIGSGSVMLIQPAPSTVPTYVLANGTGAQEPYDGSQVPYYYNYPVVVKSADGNPLIGVPIYNAAGTQLGTDYGTVTYLLPNGTAACPGVPVNADGTAPLATSCLQIDTSNNQIPNLSDSYTLTPMYTGNSAQDYAAVSGTPVTFIALAHSLVTITANPASLTVSDGSSTTATLTLTSLLGYGVAGANGNLNNYSLPLELDCDNLPAHATCSFSYPTPDPSDPDSVDVNPTTPGTVTMTINTNVSVGTTTASIAQSPVIFAGLFGVGLLSFVFRRKKLFRTPLLRVIGLLLFTAAALGLSACSTKDISAVPVLTTPKGTYNITVTAKQVGSKTVPGSTPGTTVTVQGNGNQMSYPFQMSVVVQ